VFTCISCQNWSHELIEVVYIIIQNRTDDDIFVTLYPKKMGTNDTYPLYPMCKDCLEIGQKEPKFRLFPVEDRFSEDKY